MDETLRQLLVGMFQLSQQNEQLRARVAELEHQVRQRAEADDDQEMTDLIRGGPGG